MSKFIDLTNVLLPKSTPGLTAGINGIVINISGVIASDGVLLQVESLEQTFNYNGDGTVNYIEVFLNEHYYRQTFYYSGGKVVRISRWVRQ